MHDLRIARATAELIRDPGRWSEAHVLVQRTQIAQGDLEGARRSFDQQVVPENQPDVSSFFCYLESARQLGVGFAKAGRTDEARKLMAGALSRMRKANTKGDQTEFLKQFEAQIPITVVYGLIEGRRFAEAAKEMSSIHDEALRNGLTSQWEVARIEAGEAPGPANTDVWSPGTVAGKAAKARKLAQSGQFAEAFKLAEPLPPRDSQSVFGAAVQAAIKSNALAQAQQALKRFPVAQAQGQWDDGGTGFKVSLLQQLAKAQAEHQLTNEACATLREAATLCEKSENQNLRFELARIVPQLAELGDAEDALATLAAQKSRVLLFTDAAAATGEALMRCMGPLDAISIARAQKDEDLELYLLLGVVGAIGGK
jgi:hypothetical protein